MSDIASAAHRAATSGRCTRCRTRSTASARSRAGPRPCARARPSRRPSSGAFELFRTGAARARRAVHPHRPPLGARGGRAPSRRAAAALRCDAALVGRAADRLRGGAAATPHRGWRRGRCGRRGRARGARARLDAPVITTRDGSRDAAARRIRCGWACSRTALATRPALEAADVSSRWAAASPTARPRGSCSTSTSGPISADPPRPRPRGDRQAVHTAAARHRGRRARTGSRGCSRRSARGRPAHDWDSRRR